MRETNESEIPGVIVPSGALASEAVDPVDTLAAISTGVGQTLVDVGLAVLAREARDALACVPGDIRSVKDTEIGKSYQQFQSQLQQNSLLSVRIGA